MWQAGTPSLLVESQTHVYPMKRVFPGIPGQSTHLEKLPDEIIREDCLERMSGLVRVSKHS